MRLDILILERGLAKSREQAQALILAGEVWHGETRLEKAGEKYDEALPIEVRSKGLRFVSRAGLKLEHALDHFGVNPNGQVCLDVGASTGGFTDCLLKRGAAHVFAVDVGYGQLDSLLRGDSRVTTVERTNARHLTQEKLVALNPLATQITLAVVDVSFISLKTILPPLMGQFPGIRHWLLLFKPQFEVGRKFVGKGGLVRSEEAVNRSLEAFHSFLVDLRLTPNGVPQLSPLAGKKSGNLEYLLHYEKNLP